MRKYRIIIALVSAIILILSFFIIDYQNFISRQNLGAFLVIVSSIFNIVAMILSNRHEKKLAAKKSN